MVAATLLLTAGAARGEEDGGDIQVLAVEVLEPSLSVDAGSLQVVLPPRFGEVFIGDGGLEYLPDGADPDEFQFVATADGEPVLGAVRIDPLTGSYELDFRQRHAVGDPTTPHAVMSVGVLADGGAGVAADGLTLAIGSLNGGTVVFGSEQSQALGLTSFAGFRDEVEAEAFYQQLQAAEPERIGKGMVPPPMPRAEADTFLDNYGDRIAGCFYGSLSGGLVGSVFPGIGTATGAVSGCIAGAVTVYVLDPDPGAQNPEVTFWAGFYGGLLGPVTVKAVTVVGKFLKPKPKPQGPKPPEQPPDYYGPKPYEPPPVRTDTGNTLGKDPREFITGLGGWPP